MSEKNKSGVLKNIFGAIVEPREAMQRISEEQKILKYLIPIIIVQLIVSVSELPKLINFSILQAQELPNFSQNTIPMLKTIVTISVMVAPILTPVLTILVVTAVIKLITMFMQEDGGFKQLFCVNILAYIPMVIAGVVGAIVMAFTDPQNIKNVSTNLTVFLGSSVSEKSIIYKLFSSIDPFLIWSLILVAIGISVVYKMNIKKSTLIIFGIYIVGIAIRIFV
ncbi:YIP1 family protein [Clostridiaceae bacterium UIB06]|uniref:YIP1 family protein n=1 Tax=Clostridium thailandense TaxID=2794346 RepID=A0A949TWB8_9CLOT|nr:Yip1 family protein [Clostridium thailandense]MBV7272665.1 YIP1 family protein [Clostridium thailandense]MCH5137887.1 YIP1 family protein [Clostridiaceae bacterium UIB06]